VYTDPKREAPAKAGEAGSYPCFGGPNVSSTNLVLAWAPGVPPTTYGEGIGLKLPKGSGLIMQVHYHPAATERVDTTHFELSVLSTPPQYVMSMFLIGNASRAEGTVRLLPGAGDPEGGPAFLIPAGARGHVERMTFTVPETIRDAPTPRFKVHTVGSHMHWAGVDMKIDVTRAKPESGQPAQECLLQTPKYDFNWQRGYHYDAPFEELPDLGPGDTLHLSCTYDNSMGNPYVRRALVEKRMSAPVDIALGEETLDEMCLGAFGLVRMRLPGVD
jgi:hypothetical protein